MKKRTAVPVILALAALVAWGLYALFTRFPTMPDAATVEASSVDAAWNALLVVEGAVYALSLGYLIYCFAAFRSRRPDDQGEGSETTRGRSVEVAWIGLSVALTLTLAAIGAHELHALISNPQADIDIEVRASQFSWEFYYPAQKQYGDKLYLEKGKRHRLILTSKDVIHSFWVPEFRVKQDAVPGKAIPLIITPIKTGEYRLLCNQLCGWGHTDMQALVQVQEHEDFEKSLHDAEF